MLGFSCGHTNPFRGRVQPERLEEDLRVNHRGIALCCLLLVPAMAWTGQKSEGKNHSKSPTLPAQLFPLTPAQQINSLISHMLAAWQIGDVRLLHRYYADDVTVVSGFNQPNIEGWENYLASYEAQRRRMRSCQIIRRNTFVDVHGDVAWACYQWQFGGLVDGHSVNFDGHTTLIFERRKGSWLIVLNHTSLDAPPETVSPPRPNGGTPATLAERQGPGKK